MFEDIKRKMKKVIYYDPIMGSYKEKWVEEKIENQFLKEEKEPPVFMGNIFDEKEE